jgi:hypothetical protein
MAAKLYGAGHHADERPAGNPAVVAEIDAAKAAKRIVAEAKAQEKAKTAGRRPDPDAKALGGMWADQVERIEGEVQIIENLLAPGNFAILTGHPGSGKSVVAPYLAFRIARGEPVFDRETTRGSVLYCAAEDARFSHRVRALRQRLGEAEVHFITAKTDHLALHGEDGWDDIDRIVATIKLHGHSILFLDTLAAAFAGVDENDGRDMATVVEKVQYIIEHAGVAVFLVHHLPKAGTTPRGHGVLNGAPDLIIRLKEPAEVGDAVVAELDKNRNGQRFNPKIAFRIDAEVVGTTVTGKPLTAACLVEDVAASTKRPEVKLTKHQRDAKGVLDTIIASRPLEAPALDHYPPPSVPCAKREDWIERCVEVVVSEATGENRRRVVRKLVDALIHKRVVCARGDLVWYRRAEDDPPPEAHGAPTLHEAPAQRRQDGLDPSNPGAADGADWNADQTEDSGPVRSGPVILGVPDHRTDRTTTLRGGPGGPVRSTAKAASVQPQVEAAAPAPPATRRPRASALLMAGPATGAEVTSALGQASHAPEVEAAAPVVAPEPAQPQYLFGPAETPDAALPEMAPLREPLPEPPPPDGPGLFGDALLR